MPRWHSLASLLIRNKRSYPFVNCRLGWNTTGTFLNYLIGSFKLSIVVRNVKTHECALIRFPIPGKVYGPWLEQKVKNEVITMKYLSQHTTVPIIRVYHWVSLQRAHGGWDLSETKSSWKGRISETFSQSPLRTS
jgi:hypothetical protein